MSQSKMQKLFPIIVSFIVGVSFIFMASMLINDYVEKGRQNWVELIYLIFICSPLLGFGINFILSPLHRVKIIEKAVGILIIPLLLPFALGIRILPYHAFASAFVCSMGLLLIIPIYSWKLFSWLGVVSSGQERPFTYVALIVAFLVINYLGMRAASGFLWVFYDRYDYSKFLASLKPKWIRLYIYVFAAGAYILSNVEKFVEHEVFHAKWWGVYKSILIETLLTYIIIDTAIQIWKENIVNKKKIKNSNVLLVDDKVNSK